MQIPDPVGTGRRLRALRLRQRLKAPAEQKYRWSMSGVGRQIGVHGSTICRLENGKFHESNHLRDLSHLYGVSLSYLLFGEEESVEEVRVHDLVSKILALSQGQIAQLEVIIDRMLSDSPAAASF